MDETSIAPEPVVLPQDEGSEIHLQAATQAGPRHIDIRIWRRGPAGFAPSRNALDVGRGDVAAIREGITRLLAESGGGTRPIRIVLEREEGHRLRAETEPFGTKHLAKLVFWQRVRDTWRPVDDGLMVMADRLEPMLQALERFVPWLEVSEEHGTGTADTLKHHDAHRWPNPGADWLTLEPGRVIFHPRGIRITGSVRELAGRHVLVLHQWRREETLWVPGECRIELSMVELDSVLSRLRAIEAAGGTATAGPVEGATVQLTVDAAGQLAIGRPGDEAGPAPCAVTVPVQESARLGRALLLGGSHLARSLSAEERSELEAMREESPAVAQYEAATATPEPRARSSPSTPGYPSIREMILNTMALPTARPRDTEPAERRPHRDQVDHAGPEREDEPETEEALPPEEPGYLAVQDIQLDRHRVHISVRPGEDGRLSLQWSDRALALPANRLGELISDLRDLYYDALRGRRGRPITVETQPPVTISVLHQGTQLYFALAQETEGAGTHLSFPANEVPVFLDAARAALATLEGERSE